MIKLTIFPARSELLTDQSWEYLKAIGNHVSSASKECTSIMEYAIMFSRFAENIELQKSFAVKYYDGVIKLYSSADYADRYKKQPYPIATLEADTLSY